MHQKAASSANIEGEHAVVSGYTPDEALSNTINATSAMMQVESAPSMPIYSN
jgi:hypothetical protein